MVEPNNPGKFGMFRRNIFCCCKCTVLWVVSVLIYLVDGFQTGASICRALQTSVSFIVKGKIETNSTQFLHPMGEVRVPCLDRLSWHLITGITVYLSYPQLIRVTCILCTRLGQQSPIASSTNRNACIASSAYRTAPRILHTISAVEI